MGRHHHTELKYSKDFGEVDFVIEAVTESEAVKSSIFSSLDKVK